jgi:hypothetical protein
MSSTIQESTPSNVITGNQITPLPIGPGGNNSTKTQFNDLNSKMTMMIAQATENSKFDPPSPKPVTKPLVVEKFCSHSIPSTLATLGVLFFLYGLLRK